MNGPEQCDGAPTKSCVDLGFDQGFAGCSVTCQYASDVCTKYHGWKVAMSASALAAANVGPGLSGVWGSGPDDVYAVGNAVIEHWDGLAWSSTSRAIDGAASISAVWGSGPADVFVVGQLSGGGPAAFHWNGSQWSTQTLPGAHVSHLWGSGPGDVYAVGDEIHHWNGAEWSTVTTYPGQCSTSPSDPSQIVCSPLNFTSVWASGPSDVYVANFDGSVDHWDGTAWTVAIPSGSSPIFAVWGSGPHDVFGVGAAGAVMRFDGSSWSRMTSGVTANLISVSGTGPDDVFAVGTISGGGTPTTAVIVHWNGTTWTATTEPGTELSAVWTSASAGFAVGGEILRLDETSWGTHPFAGLPPVLDGVWSDGPDDLFAVGEAGTLAHWNGAAWGVTVLDPTVAMHAVWGNGASDVLAVGDSVAGDATAMLAHWDGTGWSHPSSAPSLSLRGSTNCGATACGLFSVWSRGPSDTFVVGGTLPSLRDGIGVAFHWDGTTWSDLIAGSPGGMPPTSLSFPPLTGVWGSAAGDVVAIGSSPYDAGIFRWRVDAGWVGSPQGYAPALGEQGTGIWGSGPNDLFVVAGYGGIAQWNGTSWRQDFIKNASLSAVAGSGAADVFAAGTGILLHRRAGTWEQIALPANAGAVRGLWVTPSRVTLVGTMGELHLDRPSVTCVGPEDDCTDGWDNDCDGLADADDPDCAGRVTEQCANGVDDDGDGLVDCTDPDCVTLPTCRPGSARPSPPLPARGLAARGSPL